MEEKKWERKPTKQQKNGVSAHVFIEDEWKEIFGEKPVMAPIPFVNDMQKKSLEAFQSVQKSAEDVDRAAERIKKAMQTVVSPFNPASSVGIDPSLLGLSGPTGMVESLAERQKREQLEKEAAQLRLVNRIHDAIDALLCDQNLHANALLINPVDYRMLLCHRDNYMMLGREAREYRGLKVIESFDVAVGEVRVAWMK